jgi:peptide/nickel transport system substrate-binding protein
MDNLKNKIYRAILLIFSASLVFFTSCQQPPSSKETPQSTNTSSGKPVNGDWVVLNIGSDPDTLNPVTSADYYAGLVSGLVFDGMLAVDKDANDIPQVAKSWEISKDNLTFTFHLRDDVKFHDGVPLTAEDVKYTYDKIIDPKSLAENKKADFEFVDKVEVLDKYTLRAHYKKPYAPALDSWGFAIIPKHIFEKESNFLNSKYNRAPIGSGPYIFEKWDSNQVIMLKANDQYWGGRPHLDKVVFKMIPEPEVAFNALLKGDLDAIDRLTPIQWMKQSNSTDFEQKFEKIKFYSRGFGFIGWNEIGNPFFGDKRVRQAMTYALNRQEILDKILYGLGEICTGPFYPLSWAYNTAVRPYPFDLDKAKALLDQAGWKVNPADGIRYKNGKKFEFEFLYPSASDLVKRMTPLYQEDLKKIGIILKPRQMEFASFLIRLKKRDFQAVTLRWSLGIDPDPYMIWHSSQRKLGLNYVDYSNSEVDKLMEEARTTFDRNIRAKDYHRVHEIIHEEQPYTFLFLSSDLMAVDRRFHGVEVSSQGLGVFDYYPGQLAWWVPKNLQKYRSQ